VDSLARIGDGDGLRAKALDERAKPSAAAFLVDTIFSMVST
jgi:hypothetical protein